MQQPPAPFGFVPSSAYEMDPSLYWLTLVNRDAKSHKGVIPFDRTNDAADAIRRGTGGFDVPSAYRQGPTVGDLMRWLYGEPGNTIYKTK